MKIEKDGYRLVIHKDRINTDIYLDRRCGVSWPLPGSKGYAVIIGLHDIPVIHNLKPLKQLAETTENNRDKFFKLLVALCRKYYCSDIFADCMGKGELMQQAFARYVHRYGVKGLRLNDMSVFGDIEDAAPMISEHFSKDALMLQKGSILTQEAQTIRPEDARVSVIGQKPAERWPAMAALSRVMISYDIYPFSKPRTKRRQERRGGYA